MSILGQHCCICAGVCHHIGGPHYCDEHRLMVFGRAVSGWPVRGLPKPCSSQFTAVLGFPTPTTIPCGLAAGHSGPHTYHAEWESGGAAGTSEGGAG